MKPNQESELTDKIYKILFDKSKVDVVRVLYEDEWPIDELANLISHQREEVIEEIDKELDSIFSDFDMNLHENPSLALAARIKLKINSLKGNVNQSK